MPNPNWSLRIRMAGLLGVGAAVILAGVGSVLTVTVDDLLIWDAGAAENWAGYAADNIADIDAIARGQPASAKTMEFLGRSHRIRHVFGLEIIDPNGNVQLSSGGSKITTVRGAVHNDEAAHAAKLGQPTVAVRAGTPPSRPRYYAEAYLPVPADGVPQAIVAAYVNLTEQHDRLRNAFILVASILCLLTGVAVGIPSLAWYRRTKERRRADERVHFLAHHDALTGLANRALFAERTDGALHRLSRSGTAFCIFLVDLDRFKTVNDSLGHLVGDALLKEVALRLRGCVHESDLVARFGGDEFAILHASHDEQRESAVVIANRIRDVITAPYALENHRVNIATSIGIALAPAHGTQVGPLLKRADLALYLAKAEGRNQYRLFETALEDQAQARVALEIDLRRALKPQQFELHYQPMIEISTGAFCGAEALLRWNHPQHGMISPERFLAVAEDIGLIVELGEWVLRTACADAVRWPAPAKVAVNLSPAQFGRGDLVGVVSQALLDSKLPPERLELEITELMLFGNNQENIALLHQLKSLGVSIVLDDFGSGSSSLSSLKMFPFDKIKIDRSFVNDLGDRADGTAIVCAVVGLGRSLDVATTAEGIETEEQYRLLRTVGCRFGQGYLLGRPTNVLNLSLKSAHAPQETVKVA